MGQMLFDGRNEIRYGYGRYGYTRGGGKTWHGGVDIVGLDDDTVRMPWYHGADGTVKTITGTVTRARIVLSHASLTWEWGYYVCVRLDADQTPDAVNYLYFCHNASLLVKQGDKVKSGDALAVMGNTGNAAEADPPYKHCHFEVRKTSGGTGLDPTAYCGFANAVGVYGDKPDANAENGKDEDGSADRLQKITIGPVSSGDAMQIYAMAQQLGLDTTGLYKAEYVEG